MSQCSSMTDCYNCTSTSWGCHWCSDNTCSSYSSLHCLYGQTCASPSSCIRDSAEFHGYQAPPAKAVILFLVLALIVMAACIGCVACCFSVWDKRRLKELKLRQEARARRQQIQDEGHLLPSSPPRSSQELSSISRLQSQAVTASFRNELPTPDAASSSSSSSAPRVTITTRKKNAIGSTPGGADLSEGLLDSSAQSSDATIDAGGSRYNIVVNPDGSTTVAAVPAAPVTSPTSASAAFPPVALPPLPRKQRLIRNGAKFCAFIACLGTLITLIIVCLMYPSMPKYSVCNKDIEWGSILTNIVKFSLSVDVDLHLSVWNPNRFHLMLNRIDARILYGQADLVGTGSVYNVSFNAGSINDFILGVNFAPTLTSAASMLKAHLKGQLLLDVLFDLDTSVLVSDFARPVFHVNTSYVFEGLDAEGAAQREYCKCQDENKKSWLGFGNTIGDRYSTQQTLNKPKINVVTRIHTTAENNIHRTQQQQQLILYQPPQPLPQFQPQLRHIEHDVESA